MVILLVYVDDILLTGNSFPAIQEVKQFLNDRFKIKDLGQLRYFLGMEISRSKHGLVMKQRKYALYILSETGQIRSRPTNTPYEQHLKLTFFTLTRLLAPLQ